MANNIDFNVNSNAVTVLNQTGAAAENTAKGFTSAKAELRALQQQLLQMDSSSEEFKKASARAAELKDNIGDLSAEINANAGNAFEGLSNNVGLFGSRLMSLDLKGAGQALKNMGTNVSSINFKALKDEMGGLISGLASLGKAILSNPILLLASVITGIIVYWKELQGLFNSAKIDKLEKQKQVLDEQATAMERQMNIQKKIDINNASTYEQEKQILQTKIKSADKEIEIARLKGDTDKMTEAIKNKEQTVYDLKLLQAQEQGKLNKAIDDARRMVDKDYDVQRKREEATKGFVEAQEKLVKDEELRIRQQTTANKLFGNTFQTNKQITGEIYKQGEIQKGNGSMLFVQNTQEEKKHLLFQKQLSVNEQALANKKTELGYLKEASQLASDAIKTEEQLAKEAEDKRKKEERDAENKRKREERLAKLEEQKKKLAEDVLAIEKEMAEFQRRNQTPQQAELFQLEEKYKVQKATFEQAKVSQEELTQLETNYLIKRAEINKKYSDEQYVKDEAKRQKEIARAEQQFQELQRLQSTAKENEINDAVLASEKLQELAVGNIELETKIQEDLQKKIAEINKKYSDAEIEATKKAEEEKQAARQTAQDFRLRQLNESFAALGALNDAFTKKGQEQSKKQFQIQKALNLASAVVDTYGGINRALNDKTMPSTTARIVQASIVGAMGLANVLKISKTEYGNASAPSGTNMSAGGGDGGTTAPSPANFAFVGNQPNQQPPLQAYVVSTQVSSNLEAQQLINNQARLGG
jgi:hypothetical protein